MRTTNWNIGALMQQQVSAKNWWWLLVLSILGFTGCKYDDLTMAAPNDNIRMAGSFIQNNYDTQLFYAALKKTGYDKEVNEKGPFTLLVPNDNAFREIGVTKATDFDKMNLDSLKRIVGYHILPRRLYVQDIPSNTADMRYATLEGSELYASFAPESVGKLGESDKLYFSGAKASRRDVAVANGVIHILDKVMKPQFEVSVQDWLAKRPAYSVFVAGLKKFGLWDELAGNGPVTVFVPSNAVLEKLGITSKTMEELTVDKYDGDVLFGAYIIYRKHFFISDPVIFAKINSGSGGITYKLRDNQHVAMFAAAEEYPTWLLAFNLSLRAGSGPFDGTLATASSNIQANMDFLCSNGLIHLTETGLLRPDQAIKK